MGVDDSGLSVSSMGVVPMNMHRMLVAVAGVVATLGGGVCVRLVQANGLWLMSGCWG